jgi:hypothetical protein
VAAVRTTQITLADATSGVAERVTRLDGEVVSSAARIDASSLHSGKHVLEVLVRDEAGNLASRAITFTVVTTYRGAKALVDRLEGQDMVTAELGTRLNQELEAAQRADDGAEVEQAHKALSHFRKLASNVEDDEARAALKHLARALEARL